MRKKTGKLVKCFICPKLIYRSGWELKKKKRFFCSPECFSKYQQSKANTWNKYWLGKKRPPFSKEWRKKLSISNKGKNLVAIEKLSKSGAYSRARAKFKEIQPCKICDQEGIRHHIDGNQKNNQKSNIEWLCKRHHNMQHAFERKIIKALKIGLVIRY